MARRLLAVLAAARGNVVRAEQVADLLWPEGSPASATKTLQTHVVHLRRALGNTSVVYRAAGYALAIDSVCLDAAELERRLSMAEEFVRSKRFEQALIEAQCAAALVRGVPFDEFATEEFAQAETARLTELASRSIELAADCAIRVGRAATVVSALERMVREQPLRESAWASLILVLVSSGRPSDAIRAGERAREVLWRELGAKPGRDLTEAITSIHHHESEAVASRPGAGWRNEIPFRNVSTVIRQRLDENDFSFTEPERTEFCQLRSVSPAGFTWGGRRWPSFHCEGGRNRRTI